MTVLEPGLTQASVPRTSFAVHVTYTCPLACAHCCFSSSPQNRDRLHVDHILATLDALDPEIRLVAFTGGEPFLLGRDLDRLVQRASERGHVTRIVSSCYWARSRESARKRLGLLVDCGLNELSISWDDFHEAFVPFDRVKAAYVEAKALGLSVAINTVQARDSRWTRGRIAGELGLSPEVAREAILCESPLNLTGRAKEELADAGLRTRRSLGPCPYVLTGPTLSAKNRLLACCGVIPETPALVIDDDFRPDQLTRDLERASRSALLNWLYLRGPYAIMEYISQEYDVPLPAKSEVGGNCDACNHLFTTPDMLKHIEAATQKKANELSSELHVLDALGLLQPDRLLRLWGPGMVVDDNEVRHVNEQLAPSPAGRTVLPLAPA